MVKVLAFDATQLAGALHAYSFLEVGGALLLAGVLVQAVRPQIWPDATVSFLVVAGSLVLTLVGLATLLDGRMQGAAFLGVALLYGLLAGAFLDSQRGYATLLWSLAAVTAASGSAQLVGGEWLVAVWSAAGVTIAALVLVSGERRLRLATAFYMCLAFALSVFAYATPADFLSSNGQPAHGVPGLIAVVLALLAAGGFRASRQAHLATHSTSSSTTRSRACARSARGSPAASPSTGCRVDSPTRRMDRAARRRHEFPAATWR